MREITLPVDSGNAPAGGASFSYCGVVVRLNRASEDRRAMRFNRFDLNLLVALDALLTERQVSRAAGRVALSQPAMSSALRRLREQFADELLVQVGRRFMLTPLANELQPRVRAVLDQMRGILEPDVSQALGAQRVFRIMASDYVGAVLLPKVARALSEAQVAAGISIVPIGPMMEESLQLGTIDMLIAPEALIPPGQPTQPLFSDGFSCLAWSGNARVRPTLTKAVFESSTHVMVVMGRDPSRALDAVHLAAASLTRSSCITVPHFLMAPEYLIGTTALATTHTRLARHLAETRPLVVLDPPVALPRVTEAMQWNRRRESDRLHAQVREIIQRTAADLS